MTWIRPALTLLLTLGLFSATTHMALGGMLKTDLYLTNWMQLVSVIVAFWFGERAATKKSDQ